MKGQKITVNNLKFNSKLHATKMDRNVRGIRDKSTRMVKDCARKVQSFFYVGGYCRSLQNRTHLLSDGHEPKKVLLLKPLSKSLIVWKYKKTYC
jgi:hypothetical protein